MAEVRDEYHHIRRLLVGVEDPIMRMLMERAYDVGIRVGQRAMSTCANCGRPIYLLAKDGNFWVHVLDADTPWSAPDKPYPGSWPMDYLCPGTDPALLAVPVRRHP